jgi:site-specific recombinase XerD
LWEKEADAFRAWIGECPVPSAKRNQRIFALRKFWEWAELAGKRASGQNFAKDYKTKKVERIPKIPPRKDVQELIKVMNEIVAETQANKKASWAKKWKTLRNLGVIVLMAFTGIRAKELLHLLPENVDVKEMQVIIPSTVSKTRVERVCYLPSNDYVAQLIKNVKCMHKFLVKQGVFTKHSPLFASLGRWSMHENSGNPLGRQEIWRWREKFIKSMVFLSRDP